MQFEVGISLVSCGRNKMAGYLVLWLIIPWGWIFFLQQLGDTMESSE